MKVEILEKKLKSHGYIFEQGDVVTVPDDVGVAWCGNGWAKDMDGNTPTAERNTKPVTINPKKLQHGQPMKEAN